MTGHVDREVTLVFGDRTNVALLTAVMGTAWFEGGGSLACRVFYVLQPFGEEDRRFKGVVHINNVEVAR